MLLACGRGAPGYVAGFIAAARNRHGNGIYRGLCRERHRPAGRGTGRTGRRRCEPGWDGGAEGRLVHQSFQPLRWATAPQTHHGRPKASGPCGYRAASCRAPFPESPGQPQRWRGGRAPEGPDRGPGARAGRHRPHQPARNEWRLRSRGSLALVVRGSWFDHEAGEGGNARALVAHRRRTSIGATARWSRRRIAIPGAKVGHAGPIQGLAALPSGGSPRLARRSAPRDQRHSGSPEAGTKVRASVQGSIRWRSFPRQAGQHWPEWFCLVGPRARMDLTEHRLSSGADGGHRPPPSPPPQGSGQFGGTP
jgi:hypothetical protein